MLLEARAGPCDYNPEAITDDWAIKKDPDKGKGGPVRGTDGPMREPRAL